VKKQRYKKTCFIVSSFLILILINSGCLDEEKGLVANFSYTPSNPTTNDIIQFFDESTCSNGSIISWHWDFDATDEYTEDTSTLQNPSYRYALGYGKTFTVTLTIKDSNGRTASYSKKIYIGHQSHLPGEGDIILDVLSHERKETNIDGGGPPQDGFTCVWAEIKMANNWDKDLLCPQSGWAGTSGWKSNFYIYTSPKHPKYWGHSGISPQGEPKKIAPGESAVWIVTFWIPSNEEEYKIKYSYLYDVSLEEAPKEVEFFVFI